MMMNKKKPGMGVVIAIGKPKGASDPDEPEPLEGKPPARGARPNPFAKSPMGTPDMNDYDETGGAGDDQMPQNHEAGESDQHEASEEYGAKLISDIDAVGEKHGLDQTQTRMVLADMFGAIAECLRRGGEGDEDKGSGGYPAA